jgi:hypothetical protein
LEDSFRGWIAGSSPAMTMRCVHAAGLDPAIHLLRASCEA